MTNVFFYKITSKDTDMRYLLGFYVIAYFIGSLMEGNNNQYHTPVVHQNNSLPSVPYYTQNQLSTSEKKIQNNKVEKPKKNKVKKYYDKSYPNVEPSLSSVNDDVDWDQLRKEREARLQEFLERNQAREIDWDRINQESSARIQTALKRPNLEVISLESYNPYYFKEPNEFTPILYTPSTSGTYSVNGTEYYANETYSTTGKPKVKRSISTRNQFLRSKGYNEVPEGYEVDHITPLSQGGADTPDNMQLLTVEQHRLKTAKERASTSHTGYIPSYYSTPSNPSSYSTPSSTLPNSTREIHTGSRGGQYYINSNGNKTYIKKN